MPKGKPTQYYTSEETRQALVAIGVQHGAKPERAASLGLRISALHHERLVEALIYTEKWAREFARQMEMYNVSEHARKSANEALVLLKEIEAAK